MNEIVPFWVRCGRRSYLLRVIDPTGLPHNVDWTCGFPCIILGRHSDCDVQLFQKDASRFHACIVREGDKGLYIFDLNSRKGTYVNGVRVTGQNFQQLTEIFPSQSVISIGKSNATEITLLDELHLSAKRKYSPVKILPSEEDELEESGVEKKLEDSGRKKQSRDQEMDPSEFKRIMKSGSQTDEESKEDSDESPSKNLRCVTPDLEDPEYHRKRRRELVRRLAKRSGNQSEEKEGLTLREMRELLKSQLANQTHYLTPYQDPAWIQANKERIKLERLVGMDVPSDGTTEFSEDDGQS